MSLHTPGPWILTDRDGLPKGQNGDDKLTFVQTDGPALDCETEARAHLIAAAPDLLRALEVAKAFCDGVIKYGALRSDVDVPKVLNAKAAIDAAIRKARGE